MTEAGIPPVRPSFYAYVIVDVAQEPAAPVAIEMSRKAARAYIEQLADIKGPGLRIRRARVSLYQS